MTRDQQLFFCKKCLNREMDLQQGLICSVTQEKAAFAGECSIFKEDPSYKKRLDDKQPLEVGVAQSLLTPELIQSLKKEQNYPFGVIMGFSAGIIGAIIWAMITVATGYQIGYMAIAIGALVGFAMRFSGKGVDQIFGITGAVLAVFSCLLGNFFSIIGFLANEENLGYFEAIIMFDYSYLLPILQETFSGMDLVFYAIAGYEGYKFAFRSFTEREVEDLKEIK